MYTNVVPQLQLFFQNIALTGETGFNVLKGNVLTFNMLINGKSEQICVYTWYRQGYISQLLRAEPQFLCKYFDF